MMQVMIAVTETKMNPIVRRTMEISAFTGWTLRRFGGPQLPFFCHGDGVPAVSEKAVLIYTRDWCSFCFRAKLLLRRRGYDFEEINLTGNAERRAWLAEKSGQSTVPQLFIHGKCIGGFTELEALDEAGGLEALVKGA